MNGFDTLQRILRDDFDLLTAEDHAFVIRETIREHQWTVTHVTVWKEVTF